MSSRLSVRQYLSEFAEDEMRMYLPDVFLDPTWIKVVMINEIVPQSFADDFYGENSSEYLSSVLQLFREAGVCAESAEDLFELGIYLTNAVKLPKSGYEVSSKMIDESLPVLEKELELFSNLKAVMLMGDVAKKSFNKIAKKSLGKNVIPTGSTYKLRKDTFYFEGARVFPSYIMTGKNILIEKSKREMIVSDISEMMKLLK